MRDNNRSKRAIYGGGFTALVMFLGVLAAKPPMSYVEAAPAVVYRPCIALKYLQNGVAGTARPMVTTTPLHYCGVSYRVSDNVRDNRMPGELLIEGHGTFAIYPGPAQTITYNWTLTKKDSDGWFHTPVRDGNGTCQKPVTRCPWGTTTIPDIGWGVYQFYVRVRFGKEKVVYWRVVRFNLSDAAWPPNVWHN